jgi:hypothetical protein
MKTQIKSPRSLRYFLAAMVVVMLSSLACVVDLGGGSDNGEDLAFEQTRVALQQTQAALENLGQQEQPTEEQAPAPDVEYEGISFSFNPSLAASVFSATVPGQNMGEDYMPFETYPTNFEFSFGSYAIADHFLTPQINVYPVDEYRAISSYASDIIDSLLWTLANHPPGGALSDLPFLPMWPAAQMFSTKVSYFDFQNGSGVRYLTMYGQDIYPVDNQNLFYTFQGLTQDGRYYISAVLPITNVNLPYDGSTEVDDWMAFDENWETYINDTVHWLNDQVNSNFSPDLSMLDQMMASFKIDR